MRRLFKVAALAGMMLLLVTPSVAQAETSGPAARDQQLMSVTELPGDTPQGSASILSSCAVTLYGYPGYRVCEFEWSRYYWGNGNYEYFIVGTNYQIYHIWKTSGGWKSLGGQARAAWPNGAWAVVGQDGHFVGVETIGTDNYYWCRYRNMGTWSGGWVRGLCQPPHMP